MGMETFVENAKRICKNQGIAVSVACVNAGLSMTWFSDIVHKGTRPRIDAVQAFASSLGVTVSELLGETPSIGPADLPEWFDKYLRLSPETQKEIAAFVEFKAAMEPVRKTAKTDAG